MRFHEFKKVKEALSPMDAVMQIGNLMPGSNTDSSMLGTIGKGALDVAGNLLGGNRSKSSNADLSAIQDPDFNKKLQKIADALGVKAADLLAIMKFESGVDPSKFNAAGSKAVGLIQFMPDTAAGLGTSTAELARMSAVEQLDYVYKYYKQYVRPGATRGDIYLATFFPAATQQHDDYVIGKKGAPGLSGKRYSQNTGLDINRNGLITAGDVRNAIRG